MNADCALNQALKAGYGMFSHFQNEHRHGQDRGKDDTARQRVGFFCLAVRSVLVRIALRNLGRVPRLRTDPGNLFRGDGIWQILYHSRFGCQIDRRIQYAGCPYKRLFNPTDTGRAGHGVYVQCYAPRPCRVSGVREGRDRHARGGRIIHLKLSRFVHKVDTDVRKARNLVQSLLNPAHTRRTVHAGNG